MKPSNSSEASPWIKSENLNKTQCAELAAGSLTFVLFLVDSLLEAGLWVPAMIAVGVFILLPALLLLLGTVSHVLYRSQTGFALMLLCGVFLGLRQLVGVLLAQSIYREQHSFLIAVSGIFAFLTIVLGIISALTDSSKK